MKDRAAPSAGAHGGREHGNSSVPASDHAGSGPWAPGGQSAHVDTFTRDNLPAASDWPVMDYSVLPELAAYDSRINCAAELLDRQAAAAPGRPALHRGDETWSYGDLHERVNRIANFLAAEAGLVPGRRVLLRGPNDPMLVACWLAVVKAGGVAVTTMPLLRSRELLTIADRAQVKLALCDARVGEEMEAALAQSAVLEHVVWFNVDDLNEAAEDNEPHPDDAPSASRGGPPWAGGSGSRFAFLEAGMERASPDFDAVDTAADDVCIIAFTSGTTGSPKGTLHFHRDIMAICDCFPRSTLKVRAADVFCGSPPIGFTFGLGGLVAFPMRFGASSVMLERPTPEALLGAVERYGCTVLVTAPTAYRAMLDKVGEFDLSTLTRCVSAGETLPRPTWEAWKEATGLGIVDGLGTTEMLHIFISAAGTEIRPGATGRPIPGYEARVVGDDLQPVPAGQVGRLAVRGPTGCRYLADERQRDYVVDGWNFTGDAYLVDDDGYFWSKGRTDDLIVSSGYNISGAEVEEALMAHGAVAECAVVAAPDEARGSIVKAFVVLREGRGAEIGAEEVGAEEGEPEKVAAESAGAPKQAALAKTLQDFVKQQIAPYKYPRAIEFVDALPRTQTGKVQRFKLREGEVE